MISNFTTVTPQHAPAAAPDTPPPTSLPNSNVSPISAAGSLALVRPLVVVVLDVLRHQVIHVPAIEHDELVQPFLLDALDEPLHLGMQVHRAIYQRAHLDACLLQHVVECPRIRRVPVPQQKLGFKPFTFGLCDGRLRLFRQPSRRADGVRAQRTLVGRIARRH